MLDLESLKTFAATHNLEGEAIDECFVSNPNLPSLVET